MEFDRIVLGEGDEILHHLDHELAFARGDYDRSLLGRSSRTCLAELDQLLGTEGRSPSRPRLAQKSRRGSRDKTHGAQIHAQDSPQGRVAIPGLVALLTVNAAHRP